MQDNLIIGRKKEINLLNETLNSLKAEFVVIYGRRRVGKTYLICNHLKDKGTYFDFSGILDADQKTQINIFTKKLTFTFPKREITIKPKNWFEALDLLRERVEFEPTNKKTILFFDELPWIASAKSKFLQALENFWNSYISKMPNVVLIVCGSAASWMIKNVISNRGGLHGRITEKIYLRPFTLSETKKFLVSKNIILDHKQIIELYIAIGGIPSYLNHAKPGKSTQQIINELFFTTTGYLVGEFDELYASLFSNYKKHINIVKALAKSKNGLTRKELIKNLKLTSSGNISDILHELKKSSFIIPLEHFTKKTRLTKYKLIDQFSWFYVKWVEPISKTYNIGGTENYWAEVANTQSWKIWCGHAFENICLIHLNEIKDALGLKVIRAERYIWYSIGTTMKPGAQIDLLLDRNDNCINLCEIKYYDKEFEVTKKYGEELNQKKETFRTQTNCKKSLFTTLITTYGVVKDINANQYVQDNITMNVFFDN